MQNSQGKFRNTIENNHFIAASKQLLSVAPIFILRNKWGRVLPLLHNKAIIFIGSRTRPEPHQLQAEASRRAGSH
jgi:hypothetical protein